MAISDKLNKKRIVVIIGTLGLCLFFSFKLQPYNVWENLDSSLLTICSSFAAIIIGFVPIIALVLTALNNKCSKTLKAYKDSFSHKLRVYGLIFWLHLSTVVAIIISPIIEPVFGISDDFWEVFYIFLGLVAISSSSIIPAHILSAFMDAYDSQMQQREDEEASQNNLPPLEE